jgi:hypothetical protein
MACINYVLCVSLKYVAILGASVIEAGTSESYKNNKAKLYWHGIGFLNYEMPPDMILQVSATSCCYRAGEMAQQ